MATNYQYGMRKELQVGEFLERRGFAWDRSPGSRGPRDLIAQRGRTRLLVQVKSTRQDRIPSARLRVQEQRRLTTRARSQGAIPVAAFVARNHIWCVDVRDRTLLLDGELRTRKYDYPDER
jgi:Holliday junction resolvase